MSPGHHALSGTCPRRTASSNEVDNTMAAARRVRQGGAGRDPRPHRDQLDPAERRSPWISGPPHARRRSSESAEALRRARRPDPAGGARSMASIGSPPARSGCCELAIYRRRRSDGNRNRLRHRAGSAMERYRAPSDTHRLRAPSNMASYSFRSNEKGPTSLSRSSSSSGS